MSLEIDSKSIAFPYARISSNVFIEAPELSIILSASSTALTTSFFKGFTFSVLQLFDASFSTKSLSKSGFSSISSTSSKSVLSSPMSIPSSGPFVSDPPPEWKLNSTVPVAPASNNRASDQCRNSMLLVVAFPLQRKHLQCTCLYVFSEQLQEETSPLVQV